jgi:uncharacterized phosphosugar-binding protein
MPAWERYFSAAEKLLKEVRETQAERLVKAAEAVSSALAAGGMLYVFGTGHSHLLAEELFYRAGGLARVCPILDEALMLHRGAAASTELERREGYVQEVLQRYPLHRRDCIIIVSNSGRNAAGIEAALFCQQKQLTVIAVTSLAARGASRHSSGKLLYQAADLVIDNRVSPGDAAVEVTGLESRVGALSTVTGAAIVNAVTAQAVENLVQRGLFPEVYLSSNTDGGDEQNRRYIEKYRRLIPHL